MYTGGMIVTLKNGLKIDINRHEYMFSHPDWFVEAFGEPTVGPFGSYESARLWVKRKYGE